MIKRPRSEDIGVCFDIGHATLEGGLSWPIQARLMEPYYVAVFLKDFRWEKTEKGWQPHWCNFGEGSGAKELPDQLEKVRLRRPALPAPRIQRRSAPARRWSRT